MLRKFIFGLLVVLGVLVVPSAPVFAKMSAPAPVSLTAEERSVLLAQLLEQVKILQALLEKLQQTEAVQMGPLTAADYTLGTADATLHIVTYIDLECPFCRQFHETVHAILKDNPEVSVTYRHFPLEQLHPNAKGLAIVAECSGQVGGDAAFFRVVDSIFKSQKLTEQTDISKVPSFLAAAGLDGREVLPCMNDLDIEEAVEADMAEGLALGVQGTPSSFVYQNGVLVDEIVGAQPQNVVQDIIDDLLGKK
jgi:protein-disulfide isomerase